MTVFYLSVCLSVPVYVSPVLLTVDGHTPHTHLSAGSEHPDGDLSPVGHQDLLDGLHGGPFPSGVRGEVGGGGGQLDTRDWPPSHPGQGLGHLGDHHTCCHLTSLRWVSHSTGLPSFSGRICPLSAV